MPKNLSSADILARRVPLVFLLIIVLLAGWQRLASITQVGMFGGDGFRYMEAARQWSEGNFHYFMGSYYRPGYYLLGAAAIKLFGYHDYTLKLLSALSDIVNIVLIYQLGWMLMRSRLFALIPPLMYASIMQVTMIARGEMPHMVTETGLLLTLIAFIHAVRMFRSGRRSGWGWLALAGLGAGLTANIHPDMAFLGPGYIACLATVALFEGSGHRRPFRTLVGRSALFTFAFFVPYLAGAAVYGAGVIWDLYRSDGGAMREYTEKFNPATPVALPFHIFHVVSRPLLRFTGSLMPKYFFVFTSLVMVGQCLRPPRPAAEACFPLFLVGAYATLYTLAVGEFHGENSRLFIPLLPLVFISITYWTRAFFAEPALARGCSRLLEWIIRWYRAQRRKNGRAEVVSFIFALVVLVAFYLQLWPVGSENASALSLNTRQVSQVAFYRSVYEILHDRVDAHNRLLVAPFIVYSADAGFKSRFYFGDNALYVSDLGFDGRSLSEVFRDERIRYLFIANDWKYDSRITLPVHSLYRKRDVYGMKNQRLEGYSVDRELWLLAQFIKAAGAREIGTVPYGVMYDFGPPGQQKSVSLAAPAATGSNAAGD